MKRILITGAKANIVTAVIQYLFKVDQASKIIAAVRDIEQSKKVFSNLLQLAYWKFNFAQLYEQKSE